MAKKAQSKRQTLPSPAVTHFPSPLNPHAKHYSDAEKIEQIAEHFKAIMEVLGLDLTHDSLKRTPYRVAKMYVEEIFSGLDPHNFPEIRTFEDEFHHEHKANIVLVKSGFTSFCEHHLVPMTGIASIAYLPNGRLLGLSKIPRIVRYFAKRPQLQERLTEQIADSISLILDNENVAVSIMAKHYCVIARGIEDETGHTITNVLRGRFNSDSELRKEFFEGVNRPLHG